jgi:hypothetical protein
LASMFTPAWAYVMGLRLHDMLTVTVIVPLLQTFSRRLGDITFKAGGRNSE